MKYEVTIDLSVVMEVEAPDASHASVLAGAELGLALGSLDAEIQERGSHSSLLVS